MDAGVIVAIVVGVLILLALFLLLGRKGRQRKLEANRHEARQIRREADVSRAQADKTSAEADAQAAEARRQDALVRERAAEAERQQHEARERHLEAASVDPDVDEREAAERYDRNQSMHGVTAHGFGEDESAPGDEQGERVAHYERTETPDAERERHFERDENGEIIRDEQQERPRTTG